MVAIWLVLLEAFLSIDAFTTSSSMCHKIASLNKLVMFWELLNMWFGKPTVIANHGIGWDIYIEIAVQKSRKE